MFSNKTQGDLSWLTTRPPVENFNIPQVAGGGGIKGEMTKVCARGSGFDPPVERDDRQIGSKDGLDLGIRGSMKRVIRKGLLR